MPKPIAPEEVPPLLFQYRLMWRALRFRWARLAAGGLSVSLCLLLVGAVAAQAGLSFKRPNGSPILFKGSPRVWCGPWDDQSARPSIHLALRGPRRGWELSAVRHDLEPGKPILFPNSFVSTRPRGAQLFVFSPTIEASSAEEESSGSIVFSRFGCQPGDIVEFTVDAVLGSELFGGTRVSVTGTYRGRVSLPPRALGQARRPRVR